MKKFSVKKFLDSGSLFIWLCGGALGLSLLMIGGLLMLIMINGMGYFWPKDLIQFTLKDGGVVLGEWIATETIPESESAAKPKGHERIQLKVGNRDLYGLDFRWVDQADILNEQYPSDVLAFERREWGNFYGRIKEIQEGETVLASGNEEGMRVLFSLLEQSNGIQEKIQEIEHNEIGGLNRRLEQARLRLRSLEMSEEAGTEERAGIDAQVQELESLYEVQNEALITLYKELEQFRMTAVDVAGEEKTFQFGTLVKVWLPNGMGVGEKLIMYVQNFWEVLSEEPREANTEGGIFPAIFGTVLMVVIMSIAVVPFGVLAAIYLKEYAKQGVLTRMIRIAVNNLAGVPSIVFGVFGLGFFVYAVGGTLDQLFFAESLPNPTFGTGGILWASLTLALMTVPVVIVATEEGLSAVPREYREGSLGLGATKLEALWRVVLPCAMPGILTGLILAVSRATGEVAPLMLTGVVKLAPSLPVDGFFPFLHLDRKFMHLGFHIYDVGFQSPNVEAAKPMVYVTTFILVLVVILLNMAAIALRTRMRRRYAGSSV
ncbi:MAG: phosphate ABC transporter permease PstA [Nitrospirota bacterium]|nr:phosphate ABC transporter permease PstA [Nitrospirota bacterium]MDX2420154.1 phosphate ABC transporter permease PstA [Nitrospirota bacterium]